MTRRTFFKIKPVIGLLLLLGVLGVGLLSLGVMDHQGQAMHHGCAGVGVGMLPCVGLADIASCVQTHLGVLQSMATSTPPLSQLLAVLLVVVAVWFLVKRKRGDLEALSRLRLRLRQLTTAPSSLLQKVSEWLVLHEKRDPAPYFMVLEVVPIFARQ